MGGAQTHAPDYSTGYRALLSNYRTRLFLAIVLVVAVVLGLVLVSLPRLLEPFFLQQEQINLETRAKSMATIIASELEELSGGGALPIVTPSEQVGGSTAWTLGDEAGGAIAELQEIARADAYVALAPEAFFPPVYEVTVPYPESAGEEGQNREPSLTATAHDYVSDPYYSPGPSPEREVTVTLCNPFTWRERTPQTIPEVLV